MKLFHGLADWLQEDIEKLLVSRTIDNREQHCFHCSQTMIGITKMENENHLILNDKQLKLK